MAPAGSTSDAGRTRRPPAARPPNVVLITLDQWRYDAGGFAGRPELRTPHLDALAARGTVFEAAYTSAPLCVPARASLVFGRFGHQFGWRPVEDWGADGGVTEGGVTEGGVTLPRLLAGGGYRTALVGKSHFVPLRRTHGFGELVLCEHGAPEYYERDDYHPWLRDQGYDDAFELWQFPPNYHLASAEFRAALQALPSPLPERVYSTTWIADRAIDLIRTHRTLRTQRAERPLLLWLSFLKPHHPFDPPAPWDRFYDPETLPRPDTWPGELERLPAPARAALESRMAHRVFDLSVVDAGATLLRRIVAFYHATVAHVDYHVGRVVQALEECGMLDETAFVITSDHGDYLGERGQLFKDHRGTLLYDDLVRVPLVLTPPAAWGRLGLPARWGSAVQHVDVLPTVAELAGVEPPAGAALPGRSLLAHATGRVPLAERIGLSEAAGGRSAALRHERFKYIFDPRDALQQLYDLETDPGERRNLAAGAAHAAPLAEMHARLMRCWTPRA